MTDQPQPTPPKRLGGIRTALRYTGIPPSWLDKRPKLPSRNWLIFLSVSSSILGLYVYDRRQCKQIRQQYVDKVKHLAEEVPPSPLDAPRKVTVYGAKWPGDEDYDQALKHFRKYVKPILVAAAVDYEMVTGKRHGEIARKVAEEVRLRRRLDTGVDPEHEATRLLPTYKPIPERRQRELEGGIVIIGRQTFKEFMAGLRTGWSEGLEKVDRDEALAHILENDNAFDEPDDEPLSSDEDSSQKSKFPSPSISPVFSPLQMQQSRSLPTNPRAEVLSSPTPPPSIIPPLPPLLLVPFTNRIGFTQIPLMIWDWFNQRRKVQDGAENGYRLVMKHTRPISVPLGVDDIQSSEPSRSDGQLPLGDLDFDKKAETYYKRSVKDLVDDIEKARKKYYEGLPEKLAAARALSRGDRELTKEEYDNPPPTEVELRAERLKKERRWRDDLEGWDLVKPSSYVTWDERFRDAIRLFIDPDDTTNNHSDSGS